MSDKSNVETVGESSETDSEDWDVIQHKDAQASGNSSDGESVEIISEQEAAHVISSSCNSGCKLGSDFSNSTKAELNVETCPSDERYVTSSSKPISTEQFNFDWFSNSLPHSGTFNSINTEPKDVIYICLTIFVVGLAVLIAPQDERYASTGTASGLAGQNLNIEYLIEEVLKYRESNDILKSQVKQLSEVVNAMQSLPFPPKHEKQSEDQTQNQATPDRKVESIYPDKSYTDLIGLINFSNEISYLSNVALFEFSTLKPHQKYSETRLFNVQDLLESFSNESLQKNMELLHEIPKRLEELSSVVSQHKNVRPFAKKWGPKLNKFSKSIKSDFEKMKLNLVRHILKSLNRIVYSFYKQICNLNLNDIIAFRNCDEIHLKKKHKNKRNDKPDRKMQGNLRKTPKKFIKSDRIRNNSGLNDVLTTTVKGNESASIRKEADHKSKRGEKVSNNVTGVEENMENIKQDSYEPETSTQSIRSKIANQKFNYSKFNKIKSQLKSGAETDSSGRSSCKGGSKCNSSDSSNNVASNWFINIGNHRSKMRSYQLKGDWLFERAKARREKFYQETRHFHHKRSQIPPSFNRRPAKPLWYSRFINLVGFPLDRLDRIVPTWRFSF